MSEDIVNNKPYFGLIHGGMPKRGPLMTAEQLEERPISEDSLQSRIGDIGNCIHNLSCEHQDDDKLASRLQEVRGKAWGLSIDVGALERRVIAAEALLKSAQALCDRWDTSDWGGSTQNIRHTGEFIAELRRDADAYREASK